ncbi:hypothetical protein [Kribbella sp. CA-293567]|uniref:hypothetical protein n=1 Tax=Kribbella sp. CA-293567 TaxID=3002436 RepID=UPI0022DD54CA|nr:hypothetical protein [Kribbella sp. CA-293567]WBQ03017.1 hypothetical protein OX958_23905 [Kribbella sp. CA-293567]
MTYLVVAPVKDFNGVVSNQVFVDGAAEVTDPTVLWYFREAGYFVEEIPDEVVDLADQDPAGQNPGAPDPATQGAAGQTPDGSPVTPDEDPNLVNPLDKEPGSQTLPDPDDGDLDDGSQPPADQGDEQLLAGDPGVPNPAELDKPLHKRRVDQLVVFAGEQEPPIELGGATKKADVLAAIQAELDKRADVGDPGDGSDSGDSAGDQPTQPTA